MTMASGSQARVGVSGLLAHSLADTLRFFPSLAPALLGFVATGALALMVSFLPGRVGDLLVLLILVAGGSYFTLQTYGLALRVKQGAPAMPRQALLAQLHSQILAVWAGYVGWWVLFASVLAVVSFLLKIADANLLYLVSWLPEGAWQGLALLLILLVVRGIFFWLFETSNAFLGVAKMTGGRDIFFARSFIYGRRVPLGLALLIAALPLIAAGTFFGVLDLFTINGLGLGFVIALPPPASAFLGLILAYSFILSVFVRTNAYLSALDG